MNGGAFRPTTPDRKIETALKSEWGYSNGSANGTPGSEEKNGRARDVSLRAPPVLSHRKAKRKDDGPLEIFCSWIVEHQIGLSVNLLMLLTLTHMCFPRARRHTRKFFELSYYNPSTGEYCAGWNDAWMVSFWIVVVTGLRAAVMDYILMPFARRGGVKTARDQTRFAEQAWLLTYYCVFWPLGMRELQYILVTSDYWMNLRNLWTNWPNREMEGLAKWYILVQYAFWLQQIMVIHIEERRKDHWQMFTHHIVTTLLIFTSYGYHQTKVANVILCLMDVVDILLAIAKCLKYLGYTSICDIMFGVFMLSWVAARHVLYLTICYSVYAHIPTTIAYGCYSGRKGAIVGPFEAPDRFAHLFKPFQDPEGTVCWNDQIKWGFLSALLFLQGITLMWFAMIVKVAVRVLQGGDADDVRSDDEGDVEDELDVPSPALLEKEPAYYTEEVGAESISINLKGRPATATRYKKSASTSSGVDRKELLGRIGCDKGT
ncbi:Sphingosine N-acyltransferase-like protein FUM18 [Lachnellula suecica]|uniref:Sphingosine N-acyltransferase-like protein FUM18 n=1 Tax=Lachnellula suecica TaxID=602035 RepID=A0A8T9BWE5_9HELO|nr:Sphingosine N-acyltransferase-like protein FUM18 [Lachnellula suecica]